MKTGTLVNNRYQLLDILSSTSIADTYYAEDILQKHYVALKVLQIESQDWQARFRQEARLQANLSHPNIVAVYDFGTFEGQLFIVTEFVSRSDLKTLINKHKNNFPLEEAITLIVQASAGLGYAHRAGVVHCEVTPVNMLVTPDHRLKITNFELARSLATISHDEQTDTIWGSPLYFSPEQAMGKMPSPASDVYSLGVILYELTSGQLPFTATTAQELARLHINANPIPPGNYNVKISKTLEEIILKTLSKNPSARYRTADQLGRVLLRFGDKHNTQDIQNTSPNKKETNENLAKLTTSQSEHSKPLNIFLCHSNIDKPVVRKLFHNLKKSSKLISPWLDEENIIAGQVWQLEIKKAIETTDIVLVCLSENSVTKAGYVNKEIKIALDFADRQPEGAIYIIPIRLDQCDVPDRLKHLHWLDYNESEGYKRLIRAIELKANSIGIDLALEKSS